MILRQIEVLILGRFDSEGLEESYGKLVKEAEEEKRKNYLCTFHTCS